MLLFDIYKQNISQTNERKATLACGKRSTTETISRIEPVCRPRTLGLWQEQVSMSKDVNKYPRVLNVGFLPSFSRGTHGLLQGN